MLAYFVNMLLKLSACLARPNILNNCSILFAKHLADVLKLMRNACWGTVDFWCVVA